MDTHYHHYITQLPLPNLVYVRSKVQRYKGLNHNLHLTDLRVLFPNGCEEIVNKSTDQFPGVVNPGYELGDHLEPCVNVDGLNSLHQGLVHL